MNSIHQRVWVTAALVTGTALCLASLLAYGLIRRALNEALDRDLSERLQTLAADLDRDGGPNWEFYASTPIPPGQAFLIRLDATHEIARGGESAWLTPEVQAVTAHATVQLDGASVRVVRKKLLAGGDDGGAALPVDVLIVQDLVLLDRTLLTVGIALLVAAAAASALVSVTLGIVTRNALRPVGRIQSAIAAVQPCLSWSALQLDDVPRELQPIVDQVDALGRRLASALGHERAFAAAAAHELRTPLAGLLMTMEVASQRPRDAAYLQKTLVACEAMMRQLHQLAEGLLLLARADAGRLASRRQPLDLIACITEVQVQLAMRASGRGLTWAGELPAKAWIEGDPVLSLLVVRTLLDNAVSHATTGSAITHHVGFDADTIVWTLSNSGATITEEQSVHLGSRFWRGDAARLLDNGHAGLGLAICGSMANLTGVTLAFAVMGEVFSVTARFPPHQPQAA